MILSQPIKYYTNYANYTPTRYIDHTNRVSIYKLVVAVIDGLKRIELEEKRVFRGQTGDPLERPKYA